jgi:hypothetical protein
VSPANLGLKRLKKQALSATLAWIFERLGLSAQRWQHGMERLQGQATSVTPRHAGSRLMP